ncbi:MAG: adenylate/guanylate cyclase domain-containing protein [Rhodospirillum sp.]|nr:adenylate/guanylate cyclase domain-containing protein [Rhodospirillum sp.]
MRISIAFKIFLIVLALLALMATVAAVTTREADRVAGRLDRVVETYIPAYAALARADVRSLEQALALRRLVIGDLAGVGDDAARTQLRAQFDAKAAEKEQELATARRLLAAEIASAEPLADVATVARLDALVEFIEQQRDAYNDQVAAMLDRLESGDRPALVSELDRLEVFRDDLNQRLEEARSGMRTLLRTATAETQSEQRRVTQISIVVTVLAAMLGVTLAAIMTLALIRPVKRLVAGTHAVEAGTLDIEIPVTSSDEIGGLTTAFNHMVKELRAKARIRDTFGKYVDPRIVAGLIDRPELAPEGERRIMTVFFCDMKNFTALGEHLTPKNLVALTNRYLTVMSQPLQEQGGIIDKYIGDAIMGYWGPPFTEDHVQAERACLAALDVVGRLPAFVAELPELTGLRRGLPDVGLRIGIATGAVLVGNIGSEIMKSYTVLGGTVNLASRLERANKHYGTAILISEATAATVDAAVELREIDIIVAVGKLEPERIFEVMARKDMLDERARDLRRHYRDALVAYRRRDWPTARASLTAALAIAPGDGPSQALLIHVDWWTTNPPPPDWAGQWTLTEK